ncbi:MAG: hypothetical protein Kow0056_08010 [Coriobacteriia bacterium]
MKRKLLLAASVAIVAAATLASPAYAISSINNRLSVGSSGRYVSSGERVSWKASTSYGQYLISNPYTSDFECVINAKHFTRPRSYKTKGTSPYWRYYAYHSRVGGPAWRNYSGVFWVFQPRTVYNDFTADGTTGRVRTWARHTLGQLDWSVSRGVTDKEYTYHY